MSRVLDALPARKRPAGFGGPRPEKYPYSEWFDGRVHLLIQGEGEDADYKITTQMMAANIYNAAKRRGIKVETRTTDEGIAVQAQVAPSNGHAPAAPVAEQAPVQPAPSVEQPVPAGNF